MIQNRKLRVFLCHSKNDKLKVRRLYKRLVSNGFDVWLDEVKLMPGQDWDFEIRKAVRNADTVIVCISNNSTTKEGYIQKEIRFALDIAYEKPEGSIFLIPVRLENCDVPSRLSQYQWINLFSRNSFKRLIESLHLRMNDLKIRFQENEILKIEDIGYTKIPFLGVISANEPILLPASIETFAFEDFIEIANKLIPQKENINNLFALQVIGDGMADAMIYDNDIVVMTPIKKAKNGELVAIWFPQRNEITLKYFYKEKDGYRLEPANPEFKPIMVKSTEKIEIKGKVVMLIRKVDRYDN